MSGRRHRVVSAPFVVVSVDRQGRKQHRSISAPSIIPLISGTQNFHSYSLGSFQTRGS